jgi:hypothetical protein
MYKYTWVTYEGTLVSALIDVVGSGEYSRAEAIVLDGISICR